MNPTTAGLGRDDDGGPTCELLGPISLVLQMLMGGIAIMSLVFKRKFEHPRRPWKVWTFDVSKQVVGALVLHLLNVVTSIFFSDDQNGLDDNPCTWYFLNVLFDTTIGVPLLWACLWYIYTLAYQCNLTQITSGDYGHPPLKRAFFKQMGLYLVALILAKVLLYLVLYTVPFLDDWGAYLISWTNYDPRVQITFVMFVFPCIMNAVQYYLVDSIIQSPEYGSDSEALPAHLRYTMRRYNTFETSKGQREHRFVQSTPAASAAI